MMTDERFEELGAAFVLGALDEEERFEFLHELRSTTEPRLQWLAEMEQVALHLPLLADSKTPSLRQKQILQRNLQMRGSTSRERWGWMAWLGLHRPLGSLVWVGGLAILLLGVSGSLWWFRGQNNKLKQTVATLEAKEIRLQSQVKAQAGLLQKQTQRLVALQSKVERQAALLRILQGKRVEVVHLGIGSLRKKNPTIHKQSHGKILWDPAGKRGLLQVAKLPVLPKGKDYQLWLIKRNSPKPISAGVFAVRNPKQDAFFQLNNLAETRRKAIGAFAITLEPRGGKPQPTGPMFLLGKPS